jgi:hypothetical protein
MLVGPQIGKPAEFSSILAGKFVLMSRFAIFAIFALIIFRCPYFDRLFSSGMKDSKLREITLPGVTINAIRALLEYLYTNDLSFDANSIFETLELADRMSLPRLKLLCINLIQCNISIDNVVHLCCKVYAVIYSNALPLIFS